jgi:monoamine oxidase
VRIGVVGAGFAGLMAATRLREAAHDVVVLEARDRVGGRVWSQQLVPDDPRTTIERGAEFVLSGYDTMRSVAADLGLTFADMGMSYYVREPRGGLPTTAEAVAECAAVVASAAERVPWGTPLDKLLAEVAADTDPGALAAFTSRITVTNASSEDRLSAAAVADVTVSFERRPSYRVAGGNQSVAIGLASRLGDAVHLRTPVHAITWGNDEVRLRTDDAEVVVEAAVLAVPLAVAREMAFDPPLPAWKLQAWERSGIGHAAKLHVPLLAAAPAGAVQSVPDRNWTWTATDETGEVQPVLHGFSGSGKALAALEVEAGPRTWAEHVAALRPELSLDVGRALVSTWSDEPYSREAYSALTTDVMQGDDELMVTPVGALHFAGEHTAGDLAGLMEGALRSGERAAAELG